MSSSEAQDLPLNAFKLLAEFDSLLDAFWRITLTLLDPHEMIGSIFKASNAQLPASEICVQNSVILYRKAGSFNLSSPMPKPTEDDLTVQSSIVQLQEWPSQHITNLAYPQQGLPRTVHQRAEILGPSWDCAYHIPFYLRTLILQFI